MHAPLHWMPPTLQHATADPHLCQRLLDTRGQVWVSHFCGHCSFLLGPGVYKVLFVPSKCLFPQSYVSSHGSIGGINLVGLMVTSSKRAYAIPRSAAPRAPTPVAGHCRSIPPQEILKTVLAQSLWGLWVLVHTRFVWALQVSLAGIGFDSKCNFAPPTILLRLLLFRWMWGIFFWWDPKFSCRWLFSSEL